MQPRDIVILLAILSISALICGVIYQNLNIFQSGVVLSIITFAALFYNLIKDD